MILHRLKDIIRSTINDQVDRFRESDFDFDFAEWKKYDEEYEAYRQQEQQQSYQQQRTHTQTGSKEAEYYKVLELPEGAPFEQIKKSYRRLMKIYHPDMFHNDPEKQDIARQISEKLNEAYVYFEKKFGK
jgi:DnaJ-domain-containing protein 1